MKTIEKLLGILIAAALILSTGCGGSNQTQKSQAGVAYVEPGLAAQKQILSVIVTANNSQAAADAVRQVGGHVSSNLWLIDAVGASLPAEKLPELAAITGIRSIVADKPMQSAGKSNPTPTGTAVPPSPTPIATNTPTSQAPKIAVSSAAQLSTSAGQPAVDTSGWVTSYRFPVPWDGSPDVQATSQDLVWKLVYPTIVDIGADKLFSQKIDGTGVTVAVLDSGVYFSDSYVNSLNKKGLKQYFRGQADFVDRSCSTAVANDKAVKGGCVQYSNYSFTDLLASKDPYGHGTHVAGIIFNNFVDSTTGDRMGVAPGASILSVRVLGPDGSGSYSTIIEGIQYVISTQSQFNTRILNLSLSATQTTPYFIDPIDRAVEKAWADGITVVAAAGNSGPGAETISVPGNDPYVITVGAVDGKRTAGYWTDDILPKWSATGPTLDGFLKPDILAPGTQIISFMYNDYSNPADSAYLVRIHPDYSTTTDLFRMNGTSMATGVVSGVVALMLAYNPTLSPEQVKYRLMATARQMNTADGTTGMSPLQQGAGRVWAPDAVLAVIPDGKANTGMDLAADQAHGWGTYDTAGNPILDPNELSYHYAGPVRKTLSDDGSLFLYYLENTDGSRIALGLTDVQTNTWLAASQVQSNITWSDAKLVTPDGSLVWSSGHLVWSGGQLFDASGHLVWSGGNLIWSGSQLLDSSGHLVWSGANLFDASGHLVWSGGGLVWNNGSLVWNGSSLVWTGGQLLDASGHLVWSGGNMIWSGGQLLDTSGHLVWSGGQLLDASGHLVWSGGNMVWSGSHLVWSGGQLLDASGHLVWSGSNLVWSGATPLWTSAHLVWSGSNLIWSGSNLVWSGGHLVWSGSANWASGVNNSSAPISTTAWVDW
ncbi:MAG: S8 family serine peptidase [Anaerolineaceae bacterium]|nr:S8 family serine peptidase [Anaerolineaceae bacterium]